MFLEFFGGKTCLEEQMKRDITSALLFLRNEDRLHHLQQAMKKDELPWDDLVHGRCKVGPRLYTRLAWPLNLSMSSLFRPRPLSEDEKLSLKKRMADEGFVVGYNSGGDVGTEFDPIRLYLYLKAVEEWEAAEALESAKPASA